MRNFLQIQGYIVLVLHMQGIIKLGKPRKFAVKSYYSSLNSLIFNGFKVE